MRASLARAADAPCARRSLSRSDRRRRLRRRRPFVALLLDFPRLRFAAFEAHVGARVSRTAEADLVPGPRMRVVGFGRQSDTNSEPIAVRPASASRSRARPTVAVVQAQQHSCSCAKSRRTRREARRAICLDRLQAQAVGLAIGRHVLKAIAVVRFSRGACRSMGRSGCDAPRRGRPAARSLQTTSINRASLGVKKRIGGTLSTRARTLRRVAAIPRNSAARALCCSPGSSPAARAAAGRRGHRPAAARPRLAGRLSRSRRSRLVRAPRSPQRPRVAARTPAARTDVVEQVLFRPRGGHAASVEEEPAAPDDGQRRGAAGAAARSDAEMWPAGDRQDRRDGHRHPLHWYL